MNTTTITLNTNARRNNFLLQCLNNQFVYTNEQKEALNSLVNQAASSEDFINSVLNCEALNQTQLYAEFVKDSGCFTDVLLRDYEWNTGCTDNGSVLVASKSLCFNVPTGNGDGDFYFLSCKKGEFNTELLNFMTDVEGEFIVNGTEYLNGRFGVFFGNGFVVFEQWN